MQLLRSSNSRPYCWAENVQKRPFVKTAVGLEWACAVGNCALFCHGTHDHGSRISLRRTGRTCGRRRRAMNKDQIIGKVRQAVGKVKQSVGEALGYEQLASQGVVDQANGAGMEMWGKARDAAKEVQQSHQNPADDRAHERQKKMNQSAEDTEKKVNEKIGEFKERHSA